MVNGKLAVDGWAVTFGTARRGLGGLGPHCDVYVGGKVRVSEFMIF